MIYIVVLAAVAACILNVETGKGRAKVKAGKDIKSCGIKAFECEEQIVACFRYSSQTVRPRTDMTNKKKPEPCVYSEYDEDKLIVGLDSIKCQDMDTCDLEQLKGKAVLCIKTLTGTGQNFWVPIVEGGAHVSSMPLLEAALQEKLKKTTPNC